MRRGHRLRTWAPWAVLAACSTEPPADPTPGTTSTTDSSPSTTDPSPSTTDPSPSSSSGVADDGSGTGPSALPCCGHVALCDRPFDQVVFAGTHNSHAATSEGFPPLNANQVEGIAQQLADGIRVLLIDVYPDETDPDVLLMCHGPCGLGSTPHLDGLGAITEFLQNNPREIITIIYEDHVTEAQLALDYATLGADALTFVHPSGEPWPTLGEMIEADTRLVVTAETGGPPPAWLHHVWDEAWDTPYGPTEIDGLSCDLGRGSPDNELFLVNHWVNDAFGLPSADNAAIVNATDILLTRAQECEAQWDHAPNFLVVDFYASGDLFAVVDTLNGV